MSFCGWKPGNRLSEVAAAVTGRGLRPYVKNTQFRRVGQEKINICKMFQITQLIISTHFDVSTAIGGLLQDLNVQWSLRARWRGEQTVPHVT